jgi:hypothetical protein
MSAVATLRAWLYRLTASVPAAWHYDRLFRWMVIGAGVSFVVFVFRPPNPSQTYLKFSAYPMSASLSVGYPRMVMARPVSWSE